MRDISPQGSVHSELSSKSVLPPEKTPVLTPAPSLVPTPAPTPSPIPTPSVIIVAMNKTYVIINGLSIKFSYVQKSNTSQRVLQPKAERATLDKKERNDLYARDMAKHHTLFDLISLTITSEDKSYHTNRKRLWRSTTALTLYLSGRVIACHKKISIFDFSNGLNSHVLLTHISYIPTKGSYIHFHTRNAVWKHGSIDVRTWISCTWLSCI
jgi:hypothetical protein